MHSCLIYGIGGHAKVVMDLALKNMYQAVLFFDDLGGDIFFKGRPVMIYNDDIEPELPVIIAIGSNAIRKKLAARLKHHTFSLIHPTAVLADDVEIDCGTVVLSNVVVQSGVNIGKHCIVNASCVIDHDVSIRDFVHIAPLSYIGAGATIGEGTTVGAGAVIMRNTRVPAWTEVQPGDVVGGPKNCINRILL